MKFLNCRYYVEVKVKNCNFHPTESNLLRNSDPPKSLRP